MSNLKIYGCTGLGVGALKDWTTNDVLIKYLPDSASYFLYTYIPEEEKSKYTIRIQEKRKKQIKVRAWIHDIFVPVYGTDEEFENIISSGIVNQINKVSKEKKLGVHVDSPEDALELMRSGVNIGVGVISDTIIAAIISAVVTIVMACIGYLIDYFKEKALYETQAKYVVPSENTIKDSIMEEEDWAKANWQDLDKKNSSKTAGSKLLLIALIPTAIYMLSNNKKQ